MASRFSSARPLPALLFALGFLAGPLSAQSDHREEEVRIPVDAQVTLAGSLMLPRGDGPFPTVVLLSTSLVEDRDATRSGFRPLRVLAEHLAGAGIASIRWDDRGAGQTTGKHTYQSTVDELVGDALAAISWLRDRDEISENAIGVSGISLGGMLSAVVAARSPDVAFIIPLSGPVPDLRGINVRYRRRMLEAQGRAPDEVEALLDLERRAVQVATSGQGKSALAADMRAAAQREWEHLPAERQGRYRDFDEYFDQSWYGLYLPFIGTPFMRSFYQMDLEDSLERVSSASYFVYGGNDRQIVVTEAAPMIAHAMATAGNDDWAIRVFPGAGHYITESWGTFASGLLESVVAWIHEHVDP